MQKIIGHTFQFEETDEIKIIDWDIDYLYFSGICEDLFSRNNSLFNQFRGTVYKNSMVKKIYSYQKRRSASIIGNFGLKYSFGFEEDCGFPYHKQLQSSNITNEGYMRVANFMIENFPNRNVLVFSRGQKDDAITFDQINNLYLQFGPVEVALAAHVKSKQPGNRL